MLVEAHRDQFFECIPDSRRNLLSGLEPKCGIRPNSLNVSYGVIEAAFGPLAGYVSGTLLWVCCVLACGAVAAALADVAATLFPQSLIGPVRGAVIVGVIGGIALVNIGGVARGARLVSATTTLKLAPLAIAIVLALTGTFAELVVLSTLAIAALYIAGCAASWVLARRGVALSGTPLNFRFLGAATVIGISSMLALIALGSRQETIGLATLIGLSILLYLIQARIALAKSH
jgi:L-asparagine transporter-like permease